MVSVEIRIIALVLQNFTIIIIISLISLHKSRALQARD